MKILKGPSEEETKSLMKEIEAMNFDQLYNFAQTHVSELTAEFFLDELIKKGLLKDIEKSKVPNYLLFAAAEWGSIPHAKKALEQGANINNYFNGLTPLGHAVSNGHIMILRFLVEQGADINLRYYYDTFFGEYVHPEKVEILKATNPISGWNLVNIAVQYPNDEIEDYLGELGLMELY